MLRLIESAKLNGHNPWAYLQNVFERLPTLKYQSEKTITMSVGVLTISSVKHCDLFTETSYRLHLRLTTYLCLLRNI